MEPLHETPPPPSSPDASQIAMLGYHAYVGVIRTLGRGDDGFCPAKPAQMYMPPLTPIT
jgi:hypothetical protein